MFFSFLDVTKPPEPADLLFVFAGREERKRYGLELYRRGFAPTIVLSVGRFEWRRFAELNLGSDGGLVDMVQTIEPKKRHFFVELEGRNATCRWVPPGRYGTLTEARALSDELKKADAVKILFVSSPEHSRRCLLALETFMPSHHALMPVGCAPSHDSHTVELAKWLGYGALSAASRLLARSGVSL